MFCEHCGKQIPDGSRFCESCGAPVAARSGGQTPAYTQPTRPVQARPAQNAAAQPAKRKVRLGPILLVLALVAVAAFAAPKIKAWLDDGDPVEYRPNQLPPTTNTQTNTQTNTAQPPANTQTNTQPDTPVTTSPYSADQLSRPEDFGWFFEDNPAVNGPPSGAVMLTDPAELAGTWKAMLYRTPTGEWQREYVNLDLRISGSQVQAAQRWAGIMLSDGQWTDAAGAEGNELSGQVYSNMDLSLEDAYGNEIEVLYFYRLGDVEYGVGAYYNTWDSEPGLAALCRP